MKKRAILTMLLACVLFAACSDDGNTVVDSGTSADGSVTDASAPDTIVTTDATKGDATEGDATEGDATGDTIADQIAPKINSASVVGYDKINVAFDEAVQTDDLTNPANFVLTPDHPAGIEVVLAEAISATEVSLTLSRYVLPVDYTLAITVRDIAGNSTNGLNVTLPGEDSGSRVGFVTAATGTGDIGSWDAYTGEAVARGMIAADAICQSSATAAGLKGTFIAWLSDATDDAYCRLAGLSGQKAANCGLAAAPTPSTGPWIRMDGQPLLASVDAATNNNWMLPIGYNENDEELTASTAVYNGTSTDGTATSDSHCVNWTDESATGMTFAYPLHGIFGRLTMPTAKCDGSRSLLCMQVDDGGYAWGDGYRDDRKRVFVSSTRFTGSFARDSETGLAAADLECQALAATAELANPSNFVAWLSDSTDDAYCRILGLSGKKADGCGETSLPATTGWSRVDGILVAEDIDDLVDGTIAAPLTITETGGVQGFNSAWTGTAVDGTLATGGASCGDWKSEDSGTNGQRGFVPKDDNWTDVGAFACSNQQALYCFER